ncbi:heme peroxidase, plant/fungal/bacterial [Corchorus capsularis]|uniref:peroxidase n=1 Tax=Corchorus capsularis TaxID=210143 RepID=A0A1R3I5E5_COCAP|nr:heme peroxidase, plant/fungal/bacterial [Corchorus capsularis]
MKSHFMVLIIVLFGVVIGSCQGGGLRKNFYKKKCPDAEQIIKKATEKRVSKNPALAAKFLRMHFHDCFVRFQKPLWEVPTGRRDGRVSQNSEALAQIPSPFSDFKTLAQSYASKGLSVHDLVVLSGGHTIGIGHCNLFSNRLYNFTGKGDQDPSLNKAYAKFLKTKCRGISDTTTIVEMDPRSSLNFDNNYYHVLKRNMGLFQSDAALLTDKKALKSVNEMLNPSKFFKEFAISMQKMGAIGVLTGNAGEIRNKCSVVN